MIRERERKRITSLLVIFMILVTGIFASAGPVYAATVLTIPDTGTMVA